MGWFVIFVALATTGCRQLFGIDDPTLGDASVATDSSSDGVRDAVPGAYCYGIGIHVCLVQPPVGPIGINGTLDTDTSTDCVATDSPSYCVVAGTQVTIAGLAVAGARPLVVIATDAMSITGNTTLDVSSHHNGGQHGPGSNATACTSGAAPVGSGGGAGGSFTSAGGDGGNAGGFSGGATTTFAMRGGCPGQAGGGGGGPGGPGGGAVYLIAAAHIVIDGMIDASGAGGNGGSTADSGGGGGGSGGLIGLDAPIVTISGSAVLFADGGGGGEGAGGNMGNNGFDPASTSPAFGGNGGSTGGDGGEGAALDNGAQTGLDATGAAGGGGGGGGGGMIKAFAPSLIISGAVSPGLTS